MPNQRRFLVALLLTAILGGSVSLWGCTSSSGTGEPLEFTNLVVFALVGNRNSNNINVYAVNLANGALIQVATSPFAAGAGIFDMELHPNGAFLYAGGFTTDEILGFSFNRNSGTLTALPGFPVISEDEPHVVVDRTGAFLYAVGQDSIDGFSINPNTGALARLAGFPLLVAGLTDPWQTTIDGSNRFLYVTDTSTDQIFGFQINLQTGALTPNAPVASGSTDPMAVGTDPTNRFLYVANGAGALTAFSIDPNTGVLAPLAGFPVTFAGAGAITGFMAFRGQFLYVADATSSTLNGFTINQNSGALTPLGGFPVANAGGGSVTGIPNQPLLYVTDFNNDRVLGFVINPNGAVIGLPGSPFPAGDGPAELVPAVFSI